MSDKPMTANGELNAESARALAGAVDEYIGETIEYTILSPQKGDYVMSRVLHTLNQQHKLIAHAFARIEALEAAAREREGDL